MRKTFAVFDDLLIERLFQPVSDLITDRTGLSHGSTIGCCLDIASIAWIVSRTQTLSDAVIARDTLTAFLNVCFLLLGLASFISLRILFRRAKTRNRNPLRPAMQPYRAFVWLMIGTSMLTARTDIMSGGADLVMLIFAACGLYVGACAEQPPMRRRWASLAPAR